MTITPRSRLLVAVILVLSSAFHLMANNRATPEARLVRFSEHCWGAQGTDNTFDSEEKQALLSAARKEAPLSAELEEKLYQNLKPDKPTCALATLGLLVRSGRVRSLSDVGPELRDSAFGALLLFGESPPYNQEVSDLIGQSIKNYGGDGSSFLDAAEPLTSAYSYTDLEEHLVAMLDVCWKWGANYPQETLRSLDFTWPSRAILDSIEEHYPDELQGFLEERLVGLERLFDDQVLLQADSGWSIAAGLRPAIEVLVEESGNSAEVQELLQAEAARLEQLADELESDIGPLAEEVAMSNAKGEYVSDVDRNKVTVAEWKIEEFREIARTMRSLTAPPQPTPSPGEE